MCFCKIVCEYSSLGRIHKHSFANFIRFGQLWTLYIALQVVFVKLKRKIQNKIHGIYRIQMVSNYFLPSTFNCSSLLNNIRRKNMTLLEIPALLNTNYTVCSFLNASKENRIKILWKIYIVSEECYRVENASIFPFRNMSMRIQTYDAGNETL